MVEYCARKDLFLFNVTISVKVNRERINHAPTIQLGNKSWRDEKKNKKVNPKRVGNVIEQLNTLNKGKSRYDFGEEDRILDYYMKRYYWKRRRLLVEHIQGQFGREIFSFAAVLLSGSGVDFASIGSGAAQLHVIVSLSPVSARTSKQQDVKYTYIYIAKIGKIEKKTATKNWAHNRTFLKNLQKFVTIFKKRALSKWNETFRTIFDLIMWDMRKNERDRLPIYKIINFSYCTTNDIG